LRYDWKKLSSPQLTTYLAVKNRSLKLDPLLKSSGYLDEWESIVSQLYSLLKGCGSMDHKEKEGNIFLQ